MYTFFLFGFYPISLDLSPLLICVVDRVKPLSLASYVILPPPVLVLRFRSNGSQLVLNQSKHPMVELRFLQR